MWILLRLQRAKKEAVKLNIQAEFNSSRSLGENIADGFSKRAKKIIYLRLKLQNMSEFRKILIANRGEIALRIIRSVQEMGKKAIAVYSEVDLHSPHAKKADEAYCIGAAPASKSYLDIEKIIAVAKKAKADAIHPGYGFLSENSLFAKAVKEAGMVFIGPSEHSIQLMGDKISSKQAVAEFNVPLLPGSAEAIDDIKTGIELAEKIGYPVLIKASAGGGGKGMRIVYKHEEFKDQMERAVSEAKSAFGDGRVFLEKYIVNPKHIEFQILRDNHGNTVHVFERECSIQRRYQKVIEEAPSMVLTEDLRNEMGLAAVNTAISCDYSGAGTVEFIFDQDRNFYFLEMNTRLQVEHPVSEMISGLDLVKEQISIAEGKKLSFKQQDLTINGHALEIRVYAEDPLDNFMPDTGKLTKYRIPSGPGVRVDDGYEEDMEVSVYYDPMIAKLVVHAPNRNEAIERMLRAIKEYEITGVKTSLGFCEFVLKHEDFKNGSFTTAFVENNWSPEKITDEDSNEMFAALIAAFDLNTTSQQKTVHEKVVHENNWLKNRKR